jgi:hypothetical protein
MCHKHITMRFFSGYEHQPELAPAADPLQMSRSPSAGARAAALAEQKFCDRPYLFLQKYIYRFKYKTNTTLRLSEYLLYTLGPHKKI